MEIEISLKMGIGAVLLLLGGVGFAMLHSGQNSAKSAVGISVNAFIAGIFAIAGFLSIGAVLFFSTKISGSFDFDPLGIWSGNAAPNAENIALALWLSAFAAIFAIIPLGVAASRLKWSGVAIISFLNGAFIFPILARWLWSYHIADLPNQGWLEALNFSEFGGSTFIGVAVGAIGLALAMVAGPRRGKFADNGRILFLPGHSLPFALLGTAVIVVGWLGFVIGFPEGVDTSTFARKMLNLFITVGSAGLIGAIIYRSFYGAVNPTILMQSVIGGLVAGLAGCGEIDALQAILVGMISGVLIIVGTIFLEKIDLDDTAGVIPAHLFCGLWGALVPAILGAAPWRDQLVGIAAIALSAGAAAFCLFQFLKKTGLLQLSENEEPLGLDFTQHGSNAYPPTDSD